MGPEAAMASNDTQSIQLQTDLTSIVPGLHTVYAGTKQKAYMSKAQSAVFDVEFLNSCDVGLHGRMQGL